MIKNTFYLLISIVFFTACKNQTPQPEQNEEDEDKNEVYIPEIIESFDCFPQDGASTFEIVTWNIEQYPLDTDTPGAIKTTLDTMKVDIIAFQEVKTPDNLIEAVIDSLPDWEFVYADVRYNLEIGYAYRPSEIVSIESLELLFPDSSNAFPREPVFTTIEHVSGLKVNLINIHLKCCNDGEERRAVASQLLKEYIDTNLSDEATILLGDFNDEIDDDNNPFTNFIDDNANYRFADMEIATGNSEFWSYPSFGPEGSHIDHILISNELFDLEVETKTLTLGDCISRYEYNVSDHLPVMSTFTTD
ncbi:endonuclease/exonuclease/phosphatase family protein [Marivirga salinae]|uniref:Endonuclease/exonuclease/phosphatase family protein n=1 Tax=Marivirga salinarum TaxID=3059078 RepID=A0AA51NBJ9_9BACT|nr:endonuclease/exonuclease/phosphatase family protein [Marivirga sp. BDSF4-3]WMN11979.1 endonuclease/exonuclease/phosphatase family protein [Marivirga sp. BDSF4-3]